MPVLSVEGVPSILPAVFIVFAADVDDRPAFKSFTQAIQPLVAFVLIVTVRPVVDRTAVESKLAVNEVVFASRTKLKLGGTLALTTT